MFPPLYFEKNEMFKIIRTCPMHCASECLQLLFSDSAYMSRKWSIKDQTDEASANLGSAENKSRVLVADVVSQLQGNH